MTSGPTTPKKKKQNKRKLDSKDGIKKSPNNNTKESNLKSKSSSSSLSSILNGQQNNGLVNNNNTNNITKVKTKSGKPTPNKDRGPIDLDRHCGVKLDSGQLCMRSITCKIHPVSAKRSVLGRSQQFDILLLEHQTRTLGKARVNEKNQNNKYSLGRPQSGILGGSIIGSINANSQLQTDDVLRPTKEEEVPMAFESIKYHRPKPVRLSPYHSELEMWVAKKQRTALLQSFHRN